MSLEEFTSLRAQSKVNFMNSNSNAQQILELVSDFELDDVTDLTIVMSQKELDTILSIDAAYAVRQEVHCRPTVTMEVVKVI